MKRVLRAALVVALMLLALMPLGIVKTVTDEDYTVRRGETHYGNLFISSPGVVTVEEDARVEGSVFMGSGVLNLDGEVAGGIFSLSGEVHLSPSAVVQGHTTVTSVPFESTPGAQINDDITADVSGWMGGPVGTALVLLVLAGYLLYWARIRSLILDRSEYGRKARAQVLHTSTIVPALGLVLATVAAIFLTQAVGMESTPGLWAVGVLVSAAVLFGYMLVDTSRRRALAVPASVLAVTGLILVYQSFTGHWESWAYGWALVLPASVGLGWFADGSLVQDGQRSLAGARVAGVGFALFAASVVFFEIVAEMSGNTVLLLVALMIIAAVTYLIVEMVLRSGQQVTGA